MYIHIYLRTNSYFGFMGFDFFFILLYKIISRNSLKRVKRMPKCQQTEHSLQWFNDLYRQNASFVYKIALHLLNDPVEAEDYVMMSFWK